jgi:uncharacterized protein (DUF2236 family)
VDSDDIYIGEMPRERDLDIEDVLVSRTQLDRRVEDACAHVRDPRVGLFGPTSKLWEVNREAIIFLGAGRAALLQLAHPWVAYGVEHHSATRTDPYGRFQRTFKQVFAMIYGDLDAVRKAAHDVHAIHNHIVGTMPMHVGRYRADARYRANTPHALFWVHATLFDTSVWCFETIVRPLSIAEKNRYYEETKRFALLFGIPDAVIPETWDDFQRYMAKSMNSDMLEVAPCARDMAAFLFAPTVPRVASPIVDIIGPRYAEITAWMLPEHLARGFGLARGGRLGELRFRAALASLRVAHPLLPARLRYQPHYLGAMRRVSGDPRPDRIGDSMQRLLVGG